MLTKFFNAAALVKDFIVDTALAPLDAYSDFKEIVLGNYTKQGAQEATRSDEFLSTVTAASTSAASFTGLTTLTWIGLLGTSMSPVGLVLTGAVVGCAATGALGRACWAIANRNAPEGSKSEVHSYSDTVDSFKRFMV